MASDEHLSQIQTLWSVVRRAHGDRVSQIRQAQESLLDRYGGAARRYLLGSLRDEDAAADVYQDFVLRFVRGDFHTADPEKGKFRSFLKTVLYRMIVDCQRARKRNPTPQLPDDRIEPVAAADSHAASHDDDAAFTQSWREELLARTWKALEAEQQASGKPVYAVLRYRVDHSELRSPELAEGLSQELNREITAANVRVMLHRARERFGDLLLDQVAQSLEHSGRDELEEELIELELLEYCRPALEGRKP
jgi:RNA polymerase sigma-70 factor (ECF subfamily)